MLRSEMQKHLHLQKSNSLHLLHCLRTEVHIEKPYKGGVEG
jgi:hypothetical protein